MEWFTPHAAFQSGATVRLYRWQKPGTTIEGQIFVKHDDGRPFDGLRATKGLWPVEKWLEYEVRRIRRDPRRIAIPIRCGLGLSVAVNPSGWLKKVMGARHVKGFFDADTTSISRG